MPPHTLFLPLLIFWDKFFLCVFFLIIFYLKLALPSPMRLKENLTQINWAHSKNSLTEAEEDTVVKG